MVQPGLQAAEDEEELRGQVSKVSRLRPYAGAEEVMGAIKGEEEVERGAYPVDADGGEGRAGDGVAVLGVVGRVHHAVVVGAEEGAEDGEDDDCEDGDDDAGRGGEG